MNRLLMRPSNWGSNLDGVLYRWHLAVYSYLKEQGRKLPEYSEFWAQFDKILPEKEIDFLMNLYRHVLDRKVDSFHRKKIKINCIGDLERFSDDLKAKTRKSYFAPTSFVPIGPAID